MNPYANHPYLLRTEPGNLEYTEALRHLFDEIKREPQSVHAIDHWTQLRDVHLKQVNQDTRAAHRRLLTPRLMIGGIEAGTYLISFISMISLGVILTLLGQLGSQFSAMLSVSLGLLLLNLLARADDRKREVAAQQLGITLPRDTSRHGLYGVWL